MGGELGLHARQICHDEEGEAQRARFALQQQLAERSKAAQPLRRHMPYVHEREVAILL